MTNYYVHTVEDGEGDSEKLDEPPESGFYEAQEYRGGEVILYEVDPDGGDPIEHGRWDSPDDMEYITLTDGTAYAVELDGNRYEADSSQRLADSDIEPVESVREREQYLGDDESPAAGDKFTDFPLGFRQIPGDLSPELKGAISPANMQLRYLMDQMGSVDSGDTENPEFLRYLRDPDRAEAAGNDNTMDDNLASDFFAPLADGVSQAGEASDAYNTASIAAAAFEQQWTGLDAQLEELTGEVTRLNGNSYRAPLQRVRLLRIRSVAA